jgi:hypothetical protein
MAWYYLKISTIKHKAVTMDLNFQELCANSMCMSKRVLTNKLLMITDHNRNVTNLPLLELK